ncbi:E3 ubiquitin-protein ligase Topors [Impatiens glandulifera]|uniref:E3 ubiquitin-protein ligase Topors n=1 Tax=Impatiens glandulifera TaxID=253017 RepID=UPI001FB04CC4|nr:E3 ubiquitin-protein ligase Topors [Impatiens glandulifera]
METLSSERSFRSRLTGDVSPELFTRRIAPAIKEKSCSICLIRIDPYRAAVLTVCMHAFCIDCIRRWSNLKRRCPLCNSNFDSWYFRINLSARTSHKEKLPPQGLATDFRIGASPPPRRRTRVDNLAEQRVIWRSRKQLNCLSGRSRPLPMIRSFRLSESEPSNIVAQRILKWRFSIYELQLQAIPPNRTGREKVCIFCRTKHRGMIQILKQKVMTWSHVFLLVLCQNIGGNLEIKERTLQRVEPWIHRELHAILGDSDPSIIVHVASSLFLVFLEENRDVPIRQSPLMVDFLAPLRPFLHEKANLFWHEFRCFAQSPFNMETYDTVVEYKPLV